MKDFNVDILDELKKCFYDRLTLGVDLEDRRSKKYNSPLYSWYDDEEKTIKNAHATKPNISLKDIMNKFESAVKDLKNKMG